MIRARERLAVVLGGGLLAWGGWLRLAGPDVVPADAPPDVFSAGRALETIEKLAVAPRPHGSAAHQAALDFVVERLRRLGARVAVEEGEPEVTNVFARLPGRRADLAPLLLCAHVDSVRRAPGAADDASGVAVLLETARALVAVPQEREVAFLVSDREEDGLLGARAFVRRHPELGGRFAGVVNFEARGAAGPALLFRTGRDSGGLTVAVARFAPGTHGDSSGRLVMRFLPNDTDLSVFSKGGWAGLDVAFFRDVAAYHRPLDTPDRLDLSAVQAMGDLALALAHSDAPLRRARERVFFDVLGRFVAVRKTLASGFGVLAGAFALLALFLGGRVRPRAFLLPLLAPAVAGLSAWAALFAAGVRRSGGLPQSEVLGAERPFVLATTLLAVAVLALLARRLSPRACLQGAAGLGGAASLASGIALPDAVHLFAPPALLAGLGLVLDRRTRGALSRVAAPLLPAAPALLIVLPLVMLCGAALTPYLGAVHAAVAAVLLLPLSPALGALSSAGLAAAAISSAGCFVAALF